MDPEKTFQSNRLDAGYSETNGKMAMDMCAMMMKMMKMMMMMMMMMMRMMRMRMMRMRMMRMRITMTIIIMTLTMTAKSMYAGWSVCQSAVFQPEQLWIFAEPTILQMRLHADASCLFLITFFRHMSGLGNVLMFPASTPWSSGLAFAQSQALHFVLAQTCESTPQLDASLSGLGRGIECWQSIESEFCDYDTTPEST